MVSAGSSGGDATTPGTAADSATRKPILGVGTKLGYGSGAMAFGVKDNGFSFFLLLFYNQVLGVPAAWVGAALMIALILDGVIDPVIGSVSDGWRSRLGRRHPFMYGAALPAAAAYYMLWDPPASLSHAGLVGYLLVCAILVRILIAIYEIPSTALVPELSDNYDQRTTIFGYRTLFGWMGGLAMAVMSYSIFLRPDANGGGGLLAREGYVGMGWAGAAVIFSCILVSALSTHRFIPALDRPSDKRGGNLREHFGGIARIFSNRSVIFLFAAGLASGLSFGLASSLNVYMATYFWGLSNDQMSGLVVGLFFGAVLAFAIAPPAARRFDKRGAAIAAGLTYVLFNVAPILLNLSGLFPPRQSPAALTILICCYICTTFALASILILMSSMLADTVDEVDLATGQRSEGIIFSVNLLIQKCMSGAGIFGAGLLLSAIDFPDQAQAGSVDPTTIAALGGAFAAVQAVCFTLTALFLTGFRIDRARHQANIEALRERNS